MKVPENEKREYILNNCVSAWNTLEQISSIVEEIKKKQKSGDQL